MKVPKEELELIAIKLIADISPFGEFYLEEPIGFTVDKVVGYVVDPSLEGKYKKELLAMQYLIEEGFAINRHDIKVVVLSRILF